MTSTEMSPEQHAEREALLRTALDCYLSTIQGISEFLGAVAPELASPHQEHLLKLRQRVQFQPTLETLMESQDILTRELRAVAEKAGDSREDMAGDLARISLFLNQIDDVFLIRKNGCADQLRHLSKQIDEAANLDDPALAREQLGAHLSELRTFVETVQQDSSKVFSRLQSQIEEYRINLTTPETASSSDSVTGLPNLREFARQIASRLNTPTVFCLLIFDLHRFDEGDSNFEDAFGIELLKQVGTNLAAQVRARDLVCRWEGGKFLVILECAFMEAKARSRQIALSLSGHYRADVEGQESIAELKLLVGVTERHPDDAADQLVRRAESCSPE